MPEQFERSWTFRDSRGGELIVSEVEDRQAVAITIQEAGNKAKAGGTVHLSKEQWNSLVHKHGWNREERKVDPEVHAPKLEPEAVIEPAIHNDAKLQAAARGEDF